MMETDIRLSHAGKKVRCAEKMSSTRITNDPPGVGATRRRKKRNRDHPKDECPSLAKAVSLLTGQTENILTKMTETLDSLLPPDSKFSHMEL